VVGGTLREVALWPGPCLPKSEGRCWGLTFVFQGGNLFVAVSTVFHLGDDRLFIDRLMLGEKDLLLWLLMPREDAGLRSHPNRSSGPIHSLCDLGKDTLL